MCFTGGEHEIVQKCTQHRAWLPPLESTSPGEHICENPILSIQVNTVPRYLYFLRDMNRADSLSFNQTLPTNCDTIVERQYRQIPGTRYAPLKEEMVFQHLAELSITAIQLLVAEPFEPDKAEDIGSALARLYYIQPEALGGTIQVLAGHLVEGLHPDSVTALKPRLAEMLNRLAKGFFHQARRTIIEEQEEIQAELSAEQERARRLEEANVTLKVLLERRAEDKNALVERVQLNIRELIIPLVRGLKKASLSPQQLSSLDMIESNLNSITSSFSHLLCSRHQELTPMEIRVANLIREGKNTRDIAELMNLSPRTIESHRKGLKKKMNIRGRRENLRFHLLSLF
jgi:DNA-binding CsgD family transcriptional regulator